MHMYRAGRRKAPVDEVALVTSVGPGRTEQVTARRRSYVAVQGLRIALFVVAIIAPLPLLVRGALIAIAGLMSLFSVTAANAPYPRTGDRTVERPGPSPDRRALGG